MGGQKTYFLYADEGLVGEYDSSGQEIRTYGYKPDSLWTTDPVFQKAGDIYYWYQNDHLGTPQKVVESNGRVVWAATYNSFGNCQISTEEITNNLRFAGQYQDAETGLYYNWNRYYDPVAGRYLRIDPIEDGLNLYAYVENNPVGWIDPWGLCPNPNEEYSGECDDIYDWECRRKYDDAIELTDKEFQDEMERLYRTKQFQDIKRLQDLGDLDSGFWRNENKSNQLYLHNGKRVFGHEINYYGIGMGLQKLNKPRRNTKWVPTFWKVWDKNIRRTKGQQGWPSQPTFEYTEKGYDEAMGAD